MLELHSRRRVPAALQLTASLASLSLLAACAVGPEYRPPPVTMAASFVDAEPGVFSGGQLQGDFWSQFHDETLDRLVVEALGANRDLRVALANLKSARAIHRETRFDLFPTVTGSGGYSNERYPPVDSFGANLPLDLRYYDATLDATWELDLFGRVRREVQASHAEVQASEASLRDAQVSVTAEVARTYFELRGQQGELDVARRNVVNQQSTLALTQALLQQGRGTELDTSRAQAQLSTTLAAIPPLQAAIGRSIHRLSVLTGRDPSALDGLLTPAESLPALPTITAVSDPAGLLRRRPDIRVAERNLAAATARIGVAVGDLFPKVTFNGSFGYAAASPGGLGGSGSQSYVIGPAITWAAFDLGRVQARIAGAKADSEAALARYQQTVLLALEETENSLLTHARERDRLAQLSEAAKASATAAEIARVRYRGGLIGFLDVLDAERTQLEAEDALAQSRTETAVSLVAVYKALGGGWESAPLPRYTLNTHQR
ncbi:MAG TPA: efflux transporter outer membrane subunit [Steroidobacteraceae bacterium]|nr:efflux transporter outer membrane subunit [Steroidobacteraceae bacterium]